MSEWRDQLAIDAASVREMELERRKAKEEPYDREPFRGRDAAISHWASFHNDVRVFAGPVYPDSFIECWAAAARDLMAIKTGDRVYYKDDRADLIEAAGAKLELYAGNEFWAGPLDDMGADGLHGRRYRLVIWRDRVKALQSYIGRLEKELGVEEPRIW